MGLACFCIHFITQCWTPISSIIQGILISPEVAWVVYIGNQLLINQWCKNIGSWLRHLFDLLNTIFEAYIIFVAIEDSCKRLSTNNKLYSRCGKPLQKYWVGTVTNIFLTECIAQPLHGVCFFGEIWEIHDSGLMH